MIASQNRPYANSSILREPASAGDRHRPGGRPAHRLPLLLLWFVALAVPASADALSGSAVPQQASSPTDVQAATAAQSSIVVPAIDTRSYRALTLPNGIRAVLVSDPQTDKSAAALAVDRGSFDEPANIPGLAHFLEHMLFLGTDKYPAADEYQAFISTHGGSHNAYTAGDHTNYFFDIKPDHFAEGLDRFAQFFIAPRFDSTYVAREMNAVNSEYQLQVKDDSWRSNAVEKTALNPAHPAARFTIGSLTTLADRPQLSTRDALIRFYNDAYAPQNMTLTVYSGESLDALETLVRSSFGGVPARTSTPRVRLPPIALPKDLPARIEYKPERDENSISFSFFLAGLDAHYKENPLQFLASLIGDEGAGSLHASLKARGWIESLSAGAGRIDEDNSVLTVQIQLTTTGISQQGEIGEALFAYLNVLRGSAGDQASVLKRLYDEQALLAQLGFDYKEPGRAMSYVTSISVNQMRYPTVDVLRGPSALDHFDAALIKRQLDRLVPTNVLVTVANPQARTTRTEQWFQVPYNTERLPKALRNRWLNPQIDATLILPLPNPFLPTSLALVSAARPADKPIQLPAAAGLSLWHLADTDFRAPRASVVLRLQSALPSASATDNASVALLAALLSDELNTFAYPAALAGLSYDVRQDARGLLISLGGYSDKQPVLMQRVLDTLMHLQIDPTKFARYREQLTRDWDNARKARPYEQALGDLSETLVSGNFSPEALKAGIMELDPAALRSFQLRLLQGAQADLLVHGNIDAAGATQLGAIVSNTLHLCASCTANAPSVLAIRTQNAVLRPVQHDDAAMVLYVQGMNRQPAERARYGLLAHMLQGPYFDALRTQQALGYVVGVAPAVVERVPGISFIVQSPVAGVPALITATTTFMSNWQPVLHDMPEATFADQKAGLLSRILERDRNLGARTIRLWLDLADGITSFNTRDEIAGAIGSLHRPEFIAFVADFAQRMSSQRLVIAVPGKFGGADQLGAIPSTASSGVVGP